MPRRPQRWRIWEIKMREELIRPVMQAIHDLIAQQITLHYSRIDDYYARAAEILDNRGILGAERILYRAYVEELYRVFTTLTAKAGVATAEAVSVKYWLMGADDQILIELGLLFNFRPFLLMEEAVKRAIDATIGARLEPVERKILAVGETDYPYDLAYPDPDLILISSLGADTRFEIDKNVTTDDSQVIFNRTFVVVDRPKVKKLVFRTLVGTTDIRILSFKRVSS